MVLAEYLRARRSQLEPASFGFQDDNRRVTGLRREEVAQLAGISREYYIRLEQGQSHQVSDQVLNSLAEALCLDAAERTYFHRIARPGFVPAEPRRQRTRLNETVLSLLRTWGDVPAYVTDSNQDIVAINEIADVLIPGLELFGDNIALSSFATVHNDYIVDIARSAVAALRFYGDPENSRFQEIVGELSVANPIFRRLWSLHDVRPFSHGTVPLAFGGSELADFPWQILEVPGGFFMTVLPAEKGTRAEELLARIRETSLTGRPIRGPLDGWPAA
jgi:transcriptional regulator with XRE-family HTH domain